MLKVTLIIGALIVTNTGPVPQSNKIEMKDLVTCLESSKEYLVAAEEAVASQTSPVIGAMATCVVEHVKPEGNNIGN